MFSGTKGKLGLGWEKIWNCQTKITIFCYGNIENWLFCMTFWRRRQVVPRSFSDLKYNKIINQINWTYTVSTTIVSKKIRDRFIPTPLIIFLSCVGCDMATLDQGNSLQNFPCTLTFVSFTNHEGLGMTGSENDLPLHSVLMELSFVYWWEMSHFF